MSDITDFISALEAAQSKAKFTPEVQNAASGIDAAALKAAVEAALAMGDSDKLSDDAQIAALKKGLDFAGKLVMMLKTAPGPFEKKDLWVYFKIGNNVIPDKPGMFDMVKKQLYGEWEKVKHFSDQKAQAIYIQKVNEFIGKYGLRDE
jgi:acyl-CoA-binding protein